MTQEFLTPSLLEQPHTARDYLPWVRALITQTKAADPDGLRKIRLRVGLAKELMQEAFPIGIFASRYFRDDPDVQIALKIGSQSYDATVQDRRPAPSGIEYIEVTTAGEGEIDFLRMLQLHETGQVSGLGRVTKTGTKKTGRTIRVESEAVSQAEILTKERRIIADAIERKAAKSYPVGTALVIAIDDTMSFDRADNIANIEHTLSAYAGKPSTFHTVAMVGLVQTLFLCRPEPNAA